MIESSGLDEGDVCGGSPVMKMLLRVSLGVVDLREPFAQVDAAAKVREAGRSKGRRWTLSHRCGGHHQNKNPNQPLPHENPLPCVLDITNVRGRSFRLSRWAKPSS